MLAAAVALSVVSYAVWWALDDILGRSLPAQICSVGLGVASGLAVYAAHRARAARPRGASGSPVSSASASRERTTDFGDGDPFSLGVEEELLLVDPRDGRPADDGGGGPRAAAGRPPRRHGVGAARVRGRDRHAGRRRPSPRRCACSGSCALRSSRPAPPRSAAACSRATASGEAGITPKPRYRRIRDMLGDAAATPVAGMHVHVGMPDPETAIRAYNGLRRHLPLLQALAANSPFRDDRDAGVQSARVLAMRAWVRTGVPRALRDYDEWLEMSERLVRATALPDYTFFWWKIRPHPRLGTVEVRTMDTQTSLEDTAALAALVHALARHEAEAPEVAAPAEEVLDEAMYRAARYGVDGSLPDADGRAATGRRGAHRGARARRAARARARLRGRAGGDPPARRRRRGRRPPARRARARRHAGARRLAGAGHRRPAPSLESRHGRPGAHPELLDHRPHRPRQVDAGRPHPGDDQDGRPAR